MCGSHTDWQVAERSREAQRSPGGNISTYGSLTDFISPCNKPTMQSDPNFVKERVIMSSTFKHLN